MKKSLILWIVIFVAITALSLSFGTWTVGSDPNQAVFRHVKDTFLGTEHGSICIRVWEEVDPNYGVPEGIITSYQYQGIIVTGEPGKLIATQFYTER